MDLPYSQACENNKHPILTVLKRRLPEAAAIFEIGAGTGQHSVFFAEQLNVLSWQCGDLPQNLPGIRAWQRAYPQINLLPPIEFDMHEPRWPKHFNTVYTSNTAHIMPWPLTQKMICETAQSLPDDGWFFLYGPFNYNGRFTSDSNERFDQWLKECNPEQGIRDFEKIAELARNGGLQLIEDNAMPANNRLLVWQKKAPLKE